MRGTESVHSAAGDSHELSEEFGGKNDVTSGIASVYSVTGEPHVDDMASPEVSTAAAGTAACGAEKVNEDVMPARQLSPGGGGIDSRPEAIHGGHSQPRELKDLVRGDVAEQPCQFKRYSADNAVWQGAALRRRMHHRRSNVSLGVCAVDLSGPHEPTPRPGGQIAKDPCHYLLVSASRANQSQLCRNGRQR